MKNSPSVYKRLDFYTRPKDIDFDPHEVVGRYSRRYTAPVRVFLTSVALSAGLSTGIAGIFDFGDAGNLSSAQERIEQEQENHTQRLENRENSALEADANLDRLRVNLGEGCVALVERYMSGRELANTSEDQIVTDLSNNDSQPCGANPTEVRSNVRNLFQTEARAYATGQSLAEEQAVEIDTDTAELEEDLAHKEWKSGLVFGAWAGALIGAVAGMRKRIVLGMSKADFAKNRLNRYIFKRFSVGRVSSYSNGYLQADRKQARFLSDDLLIRHFPELTTKKTKK